MSDRKYHHGNLKAALVAAGLEILESEGIAGLSLRAIAARVGVSHAAPKNHFGSLRGLLSAIAAEGFRRHAAAVRGSLPGSAPGALRREEVMKGYVRFAQENPQLFALMFSGLHIDFADAELKQAAFESYAVLAEAAAGLDWDKAGAEGAQTRAEMMIWSLIHGYAVLSLAGMFGEHGATRARPYAIDEIAPAMPDRPGLAAGAEALKGAAGAGAEAGAAPSPAPPARL